MQIKYYQTAWNDIKNSPGWFGKLCLLALINFIPIFGPVVTYAYLYGWAREMAWGTHAPMPARIFANDDGKFWRRGWFLLVVSIVFAIVPAIVIGIGSGMQAAGLADSVRGMRGGAAVASAGSAAAAGVGSVLYLIGFLLYVVVMIFAWIAYMRTAIYDRLSAGFQIGKIWKMFRHDTNGIMRIFGMNLLVGLIIGAIVSVVVMILSMAIFAAAAGTAVSLNGANAAASSAPVYAAIASISGVAMLVACVVFYFATVGSVFVEALTARAMGYWTMQFDVPRWRGQDDPMPFEAGQASSPYGQPAGTVQSSVPMGAPVEPGAQQQWQASQDAQAWQPGADAPQGEEVQDAFSMQSGVQVEDRLGNQFASAEPSFPAPTQETWAPADDRADATGAVDAAETLDFAISLETDAGSVEEAPTPADDVAASAADGSMAVGGDSAEAASSERGEE